MNRWLVFVLLYLAPLISFGQGFAIQGKVQDTDGVVISGVRISLVATGRMVESDENGIFLLPISGKGQFLISAHKADYRLFEEVVSLITSDTLFTLTMVKWKEELQEVTVIEKQSDDFGLTRLNSVQNFAITEGKKSEVISLQKVTANVATNNARQIYSKIAGLNIWESDGAGLQLGIGGRGLSPNRTSNFNTRQNGYDISADALGYPESYYTPPAEALEQIQIIRGAASLQYGTQFGGLLNFQFKEGNKDKRLEVVSRQSAGSWGFLSNFTSVSGSTESGKFHYYGYANYKTGDGWRPNSDFDYINGYVSLHFEPNENMEFSLELTKMHYLAQQAGGLTDRLFEDNPRQSLRDRNWFDVDWNLAAIMATYRISSFTQMNSKTFGLYAQRQSLGNLERINVSDFGQNRTLIDGDFHNVGHETRIVHRYYSGQNINILAGGFRVYRGTTFARQGDGSAGTDADFRFVNPNNLENSDYRFPNYNYALFLEHIFQISPKFSITPGLRWEHIRTFSEGYYKQRVFDGAGNLIVDNRIDEESRRVRSFFLAGIGLSYKLLPTMELYGNASQNYRAINFTDLRIVNPNFIVDPNIRDERGFTIDAGVRGQIKDWLSYEATAFYIGYYGKIGQVLRADQAPLFIDYRFRGNISDARNIGVELFSEVSLARLMRWRSALQWTFFVNASIIDARYINTDDAAIRNNFVEMVPPKTLRTGSTVRFKSFSSEIQWAFTDEHFSDATNARRTSTAVEGLIPAYAVMDLSARYDWKKMSFEVSVNNLLDARYFTRRAEAYPGPGILPADGRGFFATVQVRL